MAQRYGGKFSPDGSGSDKDAPRAAYDGARVDPAGARANLMFLPPVILLFTSFGGAVQLVTGLVGAALLAGGAYLLRDGLRADAEFNARKVARRPALPRKIIAADLVGVGAALAAWSPGEGLAAPILYGIAACGLHLAAFGLDPLKSKGMEGIDTFQQDRVARAVGEAEKLLSGMADAAKRAGDRTVEARVERFAATAREMFRTLQDDPRDLTGARKYMSVYLMGARDATAKFADIYSRSRSAGAKSDYLMLLTDLEEGFTAQTRKMLNDDHIDLSVEIDVLRDRLSREGVRTD
jgi:hypothetical protein